MTLSELKALGYEETSPGVWERRRLGGLGPRVPQPAPAPALDGGDQKRKAGKEGVGGGRRRRDKGKERPVVCVSLIACRRRELDDDNNVGSMKPLRDAIAGWLGVDDGDKRVVWECGQQITKGREGVIVRIGMI